MSLKSGHKIVDVKPENEKLANLFKGRSKTVLLEPDRWCVMPAFEKFGNRYYDFQIREGDVFVNTLQKAGTTWAQEIVWTMRFNANLDNPNAAFPLAGRSPLLDGDFLAEHLHKPKSLLDFVNANAPGFNSNDGLFLKNMELQTGPRTIKTHFPLPLLPPNILEKSKVVYVIRDPRDLCLSCYHHCKSFAYEKFVGTLDEFVDAFLKDLVLWGPYWKHVKYAWEKKDHPNMHIIIYDELKKNTKPEYKRLADFLGVKLTDEQLDKVIHHTSFGEMKKRDDHVLPKEDVLTYMDPDILKNEGGFFRKGASGGWQNVLSQDQKDRFDAWIKANCPDMEIMRRITQA